jgi:hypothetical protein
MPFFIWMRIKVVSSQAFVAADEIEPVALPGEFQWLGLVIVRKR